MSYNKNNKSKTNKRRPMYRRSYPRSTIKLSRELARLKDAVGGVEYKQKDFQVNEASINWGGSNYIINDSNQGAGDGQHVGSSIKTQRLTLRGCFKSADSVTRSNIRMMVIKDKQNVLAVSDLLAVTGNVGAPFSPKREVTKFESKVLLDRLYSLGPNDQVKHFKINLPLNFFTQFSGSTSTISSNSLKLVFISDIDGALSPPTVTFVGCVSYTDN